MLIVRATKKLRQRLGVATPHDGEPSTTLLGKWYATLLPWRPQQLILLVNEKTLLPVVMPLAPGATAPARIGPEICRADRLAADLPATVWTRRSAGDGSKGPRFYDWAWLADVGADVIPTTTVGTVC